MITIMVGLPCSGKSVFVKTLEKLAGDNLLSIRPEAIYPDNINSMPEEERRDYHIAAWDVCIEQLYDNLNKDINIVLDTCGSDNSFISDLVVDSKRENHEVLIVYVHARKAECIRRARKIGRVIEESVWDRYIAKFKEVVPEYKEKATHFLVVRGDRDLREIVKAAKSAYDKWVK